MKHHSIIGAWLSIIFLTFSLILNAQCPAGPGWNSQEISEGLQYYTFSGIENVSGSAQQVFVIDLDLSNPRYALRFSYSPEAITTSTVFKEKNAIVAVNAAYERESVAIKVDGQMYYCMPSDVVMDQPVPNWKSEGVVYTDGLQGVHIGYDAKGLGERSLYTHFYIAERYSEDAAKTGRFNVREEVLADWNKSSGLDCTYDCTAKAYTVLLEMLQEAAPENNLTPYGSKLLRQIDEFWKEGPYYRWQDLRAYLQQRVAKFAER